MPTISKKIHDENQNNPEIFINFAGLSVGNGAMDPPNQHASYGRMLHAVIYNTDDILIYRAAIFSGPTRCLAN